jgi:hypothetical protein
MRNTDYTAIEALLAPADIKLPHPASKWSKVGSKET